MGKSLQPFQVASLTIVCHKNYCLWWVHISIGQLPKFLPQGAYIIGTNNLRDCLIILMSIFGVGVPQHALVQIGIFLNVIPPVSWCSCCHCLSPCKVIPLKVVWCHIIHWRFWGRVTKIHPSLAIFGCVLMTCTWVWGIFEIPFVIIIFCCGGIIVVFRVGATITNINIGLYICTIVQLLTHDYISRPAINIL